MADSEQTDTAPTADLILPPNSPNSLIYYCNTQLDFVRIQLNPKSKSVEDGYGKKAAKNTGPTADSPAPTADDPAPTEFKKNKKKKIQI